MQEFTVKVKRDEVLAILKDNRSKHKRVVEEAIEGYRAASIKELEYRLDDAKNGRPIRLQINLVIPQDHTKDYDRIIKMLEMSTESEVYLGQDEFAPYVQDDWAWRRQWATSTVGYTASAASYLDE